MHLGTWGRQRKNSGCRATIYSSVHDSRSFCAVMFEESILWTLAPPPSPPKVAIGDFKLEDRLVLAGVMLQLATKGHLPGANK